nr:alpha/beta fold hydrolase [Hyphomonas sp. Mor2]
MGRAHIKYEQKFDGLRAFQPIRLEPSALTLDVMIYGGARNGLRPVIMFNSLEFPMPPSVEFCESLKAAGYQVIFVRRPGFGNSTPLPDAVFNPNAIKQGIATITEAAILNRLIDYLGLDDTVLIGLSTANATAYRLTHLSRRISFSMFAAPIIQQNILEVFRPDWFQAMLRQILTSRSGVSAATMGFKFQLRRNPLSFYQQFMRKSAGDLAYLRNNSSDAEAAGLSLQSASTMSVLHDISVTLMPDGVISDRYFEGSNSVLLSGSETMQDWQSALHSEADRLGLPVEYAPRGDWFVVQSCPDEIVAIIEKYSSRASMRRSL